MTKQLLTLIALVTLGSVQLNAADATWSTKLSEWGNRAGSFIDNNRETLQAGAQKLMDGAKAMRGAAESRMAGSSYRVERVQAGTQPQLNAGEAFVAFLEDGKACGAEAQEAGMMGSGSKCAVISTQSGPYVLKTINRGTQQGADFVGFLEETTPSTMMGRSGRALFSAAEVSIMPVENDMETVPARLYKAYNALVQ